jgi:hypothetical protein
MFTVSDRGNKIILKNANREETKAWFKVHWPKSVRSVIKLGKFQSLYEETRVVIFLILGGSVVFSNDRPRYVVAFIVLWLLFFLEELENLIFGSIQFQVARPGTCTSTIVHAPVHVPVQAAI